MPCLEITTIVGCPLACKFCPQDKLVANYDSDVRALSLKDFVAVLSKVPKHVRIDFSGMSEPWANRRATDMLEKALEAGHNVSVYTTLQGMRDPERVIALLEKGASQVEAVVVHLPDAAGNMTNFRDTQDWRKAADLFWELRRRDSLKRVDFMTMDAGLRLNPSVANYATMPWAPVNRAGNLDQSVEQQDYIQSPVTCSFTPFYDHNVLLPNGDVVLCCMDYSLKHKVGNLLKQDYYEMFAGEELTKLRVENMKFGTSNSICRKCSRAKKLTLKETNQFWEEW